MTQNLERAKELLIDCEAQIFLLKNENRRMLLPKSEIEALTKKLKKFLGKDSFLFQDEKEFARRVRL